MPQEILGVRLPERELARIKSLIEEGYFLNSGDFLRDAVRSKMREYEYSVVREVTIENAKKEVLAFVKGHPNIYADEIAASLNLDLELVILTIESLIKEGKIGES